MPEDVAFFVAKNVRANVRELEGALRKVLAYSRFSHKEINIGLAREALKDLLSIQNRQISRREHPEDRGRLLQDQGRRHVQQEAPGQHRPAAPDRHVPGQGDDQKSLPEIGELFGGRDHTTVLHAVRKIGGERRRTVS
jgi:chromosomal replication initiator protein